jgi:hypothetical protein
MAATTSNPASQLNVVFDGTWIYIPNVDASGNIAGVNIYSPACGHPHAALFLPQLGPFGPTNWPQPSTCYMLDSHGLNLAIKRSSPSSGMPVSGIDQKANHCVNRSRPIASSWDLVVSISASPDAWTSSGTQSPVSPVPGGGSVPCFSGADAPTANVSSAQTLTFKNVSSVALCGAPSLLQNLVPTPYTGVGTLIIEGEIPYIPTIQHERTAIHAMADFAGLDLTLDHPLPSSGSTSPNSVLKPRVLGGANCGHAIIFIPS